MQTPVFINCRDRIGALSPLVGFLERCGCERIYLVDNASTYAPLLEYYARTPHQVIRLERNCGSLALWDAGVLDSIGVTGRFAYSDCDVVPVEECPVDVFEYLGEILDRYPPVVKAGLGLRIDDLPDHYALKDDVLSIEAYNWERPIAPRLFEAPVDTTLALYRQPGEFFFAPAIRTGHPYLARHTTWYLDSRHLPEDERYYREHSSAEPWWSRDDRPTKLGRLVRTRERRAYGGLGRGESIDLLSAGDDRSPEAEEAASVIGRMLEAWTEEPQVFDETRFTPWADPGWHSWNDMSPEREFCEFAAALAQMLRPRTVIETGTGQGYLTRRVAARLAEGQRLVCFEANSEWRDALLTTTFFAEDAAVSLPRRGSPSKLDLAAAEMCVLDSGFPRRRVELQEWWEHASPGAIVLVHDTGNRHPPDAPHNALRALIEELGIPGLFLSNPRGGFLGWKPAASG